MLLKVLTTTNAESFGDKLNNNVGQVIFWCSIGIAALGILTVFLKKKKR